MRLGLTYRTGLNNATIDLVNKAFLFHIKSSLFTSYIQHNLKIARDLKLQVKSHQSFEISLETTLALKEKVLQLDLVHHSWVNSISSLKVHVGVATERGF